MEKYCFGWLVLLVCTSFLLGQNFIDQFHATIISDMKASPASEIKDIPENKENTTPKDTETKVNTLSSNIEYDYSYHYTTESVSIYLNQLNTMAQVDGKIIKQTVINKDSIKVWLPNKNQWKEIKVQDAEGSLQQLLTDSFSKPICKLVLDANKMVTSTTITQEPGAKSLVANGIIENLQFFHAPWNNQTESWDYDAKMSMGNGGFAQGKLTYKKVGLPTNNEQNVEILGTLVGNMDRHPFQIKDARYEISGTQVYNTELATWTKGEFVIKVSWETIVENRKIIMNGTMFWSFKHTGRQAK